MTKALSSTQLLRQNFIEGFVQVVPSEVGEVQPVAQIVDAIWDVLEEVDILGRIAAYATNEIRRFESFLVYSKKLLR